MDFFHQTTISVVDADRNSVEMFLLLLYGGVIPGHHCRDEDHGAAWFRMTGLPYGEEADYGNIRVLEILLLKLYILCDRLGAIDLKKVAKNGILRTFDRMPGTKNIIHAFENLPPNDVVLDFLVYMKCAYYDPSRDCPKTRESNEKLPAHALVRIMHRFGEMTKIQSEDEEYCARKEFCARFHDRDTESEESMYKQCQELDEGLDCERCRKELETMKEGLSAKETESL